MTGLAVKVAPFVSSMVTSTGVLAPIVSEVSTAMISRSPVTESSVDPTVPSVMTSTVSGIAAPLKFSAGV